MSTTRLQNQDLFYYIAVTMLGDYNIILLSLFISALFQHQFKACKNFDNFQFYNSHLYKIPSDSTCSARGRVGIIRRDTATTEEIIANRGLRAELKGYPKDFKVYILSFSITYIDRYQDSIAKDILTEGQFLSAEQIKYLRKLNGDGKIIFHKIRARGQDSMTRELWPFSLVVKG